MRGTLQERYSVVEDILGGKKTTDADKLRALEWLAKHGLPRDNYSPTLIAELWAVVRDRVSDSVADEIRRAWIPVLAEHMGQ